MKTAIHPPSTGELAQSGEPSEVPTSCPTFIMDARRQSAHKAFSVFDWERDTRQRDKRDNDDLSFQCPMPNPQCPIPMPL
ncbi:MAG: hypothetical protein ACHBN1_13195 [Heteroscytonema crispum UTEX LB 1556]